MHRSLRPNSSLKRCGAQVAPILRQAGFQHVDARNAWSWRNDFTWVFNIRAVGNYFSGVTGWPSGSVSVSLGVYFTFAPRWSELRTDRLGRPRPPVHACQLRSQLLCGLAQSSLLEALPNPAERRRQDLWWLHPGGENAEQVADDVARSLITEGLPWYERISTLEGSLELAEGQRDCFSKFVRVALIARRLDDQERWQKYDALAEAEARRIGHSLDRETWLGTS